MGFSQCEIRYVRVEVQKALQEDEDEKDNEERETPKPLSKSETSEKLLARSV